MAQLFSPGALLALKATLLGTALAVGASAITLYNALGGPVAEGDAPMQPIPFSHKHHAGDDGIDCRYCHTTVENGRFAGVPSSEICLTCHSQLFTQAPVLRPLHQSAASGKPLAWTRVHDLPDFVYFDHSIHIAKGVTCDSCHGRVEEMPLMRRSASLEMQWCLDCHRHPARATKLPVLSKRRLTDCSTCHR